MKIHIKPVINRDFLNWNHFLLTNRHNSEIIDFRHNLNFSLISLRNTLFHIVFPKHNLNFSPFSLRNTRFHVTSMGKHKHKTVQWVSNGLKKITKAKNYIF